MERDAGVFGEQLSCIAAMVDSLDIEAFDLDLSPV